MHRYLLRAITLGVVLLMLGCSGGGGSPTAPDPVGDNETSANPNDLTGTSIPGLTSYSDEERIIGNFSYETEDGNRLAWGTVYFTPEGWDYRVDYISPRLKALMQSDVTRNAQGLVDLTWLKLIGVEVDYAKEPEEPNPIPLFNPGELMDYDVIIHNNTHRVIPRQLAAATQVDMFNNPLGDDATDLWTDIRIGNDGDDVVLNGDWIVEDFPNGIYYTRVRVGFPFLWGWIHILIFDAKAGSYIIQSAPEEIDPVAKGVTTTPVVTVGENVHFQDNGSFDPDGGSIVLWEWDFDNDGTFDATGNTADTSYGSPGVYLINLRV